MSETKKFNLDIIVNNLQLNEVDIDDEKRDEDGDDKLFVEINFDDISFGVASSRISINNFREGRSIEFSGTLNELRNKLTRNSIKIKLYEEIKDEVHLVGEVSCLWPKDLIGQIGTGKFASVPFHKECDIKLDGRVVGNLSLATMLHIKCENPRDMGEPPDLRFDKDGNLRVFNNIKKDIDEKDIFFVVGSHQPIPVVSSMNNVNKNDDNFPLRLNTERFMELRGTVVPNCKVMEQLSCSPPHQEPATEAQEPASRAPKTDCKNVCRNVLENALRRPESDGDSEKADSDTDSSRNPCPKQTRRKSVFRAKDPFNCRSIPLTTDSENEKLSKHSPPLLQECFNRIGTALEKQKAEFPDLSDIPPLRCPKCCVDRTNQPIKAPCLCCGQKLKTVEHSLTDMENIVEKWGEDEKEFIKNKGFSKYDHCTCEKNAGMECVFCAINKIREKNESVGFQHYVKRDLEKSRNQVDDVCKEVLSKHVDAVERDEHGKLIKSRPDDTPKLSKMLEWLKTKCSFTSKKQLECITQPKVKRLNAGSEKQRRSSGIPQSKLSVVKERKNIANDSKRNSLNNELKHTRKPKQANTANAMKQAIPAEKPSKTGKRNKLHENRTSKEMKELINMSFNECDELQKTSTRISKECMLNKILDPKLKSAIQQLCDYEPAQEWAKPVPKPLTKKEYIKRMVRRYGKRYSYSAKIRPVHASERHQHCIKKEPYVPPKMGWLWNSENPEAQKGWRPGRLKRSIRELMQYFLVEFPVDNLPTTKEWKALRRPRIEEPPEDLTQKPTIIIDKKDDKYLVTMRPLKDARSLQTSANPYADVPPIQFQISKNEVDLRRKQAKQHLKSMGFLKCTCGQPVSSCTCRSFMEKERLDKTIQSLATLLKVDDLKHIVCLSDTTDSDSQVHLEFVPPGGIVKPHLRPKRLESQGTQYDANDFATKRRIRTNEMILAEHAKKVSQKFCPGVKNIEPCLPKVLEKSLPKRRVEQVKVEKLTKDEENQSMKKANGKLKPVEKQESIDEVELPTTGLKSPIPGLHYAKNKGKLQSRVKQMNVNPKSRVRGGEDIPPEGRDVNIQSHRRVGRGFKKEKIHRTQSPTQGRSRITKPLNRWERMKRKRPVRPPWDDSLYVPPPIRCASPQRLTARNNRSPCRRSSPQRNYPSKNNKNFQNQQRSARFRQQKHKACNTEDWQTEEVPKITPEKVPKSTYHRHCMKPVKTLKEVKTNANQAIPVQ